MDKRVFWLAGAVLVLASCGQPAESAETTVGDTTTTTESVEETTTTAPESTVPEVPATNPNTAPETVVDRAMLDLVTRLEADPANVEVVLAEEKSWPDGSIGCPEPGMSYTQATVDGSRVLLLMDGRLYIYHAGSDGEPILCSSDDKDGGYDFVPPPGFDE